MLSPPCARFRPLLAESKSFNCSTSWRSCCERPAIDGQPSAIARHSTKCLRCSAPLRLCCATSPDPAPLRRHCVPFRWWSRTVLPLPSQSTSKFRSPCSHAADGRNRRPLLLALLDRLNFPLISSALQVLLRNSFTSSAMTANPAPTSPAAPLRRGIQRQQSCLLGN